MIIKIARELITLYSNYLAEIENRKKDGLNPKPIEDGELLKEIISQIKDKTGLEIGPGTGNLTSFILKNNPKKLVVI